MKISVFGLGYVGCVSMGCFAQLGHNLIGVDVHPYKVELINKGKPTIVEKDIGELVARYRHSGSIEATEDYKRAIRESSMAFICVGTPSLDTGQLNLEYVFNTARQIGESLKEKKEFFIVVIRSTVFPGTNEKVAGVIEQYSGKKVNRDFAVVSNPEFLREGSAVEDFYNPAITVVGSDNREAIDVMKDIYKDIKAPIVETEVKAAEMIKYVNNAFHATKISFANEVGNICKAIGVDAFKVMDLFKMDDRLNISKAYFNPGMAFGGSCLPKDLKGLSTIAHDHYLETPVIQAVTQSNQIQKNRVVQLIQKQKQKQIGVFGLAFKKGTDDLRHSPTVELVENLIGKGYDVKIYDKNVVLSRLMGANKSYIEERLPHISKVLTGELTDLVESTNLLVITQVPDQEEGEILDGYSGKIIDLIRAKGMIRLNNNYEGLSW